MPIDTSMYQSAQPNPVQMPNILPMAVQSANLANLGMQNRQMQLNYQTQQAMRDAYSNNIDQNGNLNQQGFINDIGRVNPQAALQTQAQFAALNKNTADMLTAKANAFQKISDATMPGLQYLNSAPADQKPAIFHRLMDDFQAKGIPMQNVPAEFNQQWLDDTMGRIQNTTSYLQDQLTKAQTRKAQAEAALVPSQYKSNVYGSRSPTNAIAQDYNKEMTPIRTSQISMAQMLKNYNDPSPQGDASLILNAYKIKFPDKPDVNSLDELSKAQALPDLIHNALNKVASGGLDQATRNNLMRDAADTYNGNYDTYQGIAKRFQNMAQSRNIPLGGMTNEPALDQTYNEVNRVQKQIGPYVPPVQRAGSWLGSAAKMMGLGGQSANASQKPSAPQFAPGAIVMIKGRHYRVGSDGDTLNPIQGTK